MFVAYGELFKNTISPKKLVKLTGFVVPSHKRKHSGSGASAHSRPKKPNAVFKSQREDGSKDGSKASNSKNRSPSRCQCGMIHKIENCWELNPEKRPEGWKSNKISVQKIVKKAEQDAEVKKLLEKSYAKEWKRIQEDAKTDTKSDTTTTSKSDARLGSYAARTTYSPQPYKLINRWIVDSGSDVHICNNIANFTWTKDAHGNEITAGKTTYAVEAYGTCLIDVDTKEGTAQIELVNMALI
jgi:hypothetical protein